MRISNGLPLGHPMDNERGSGEEMARPVPMLSLVRVHQADVGFMHQSSGVERLPRFLLGELSSCQLAQLLVDQRQELLGGLRIALVDCGEDAGDFVQGGTTILTGGTSSSDYTDRDR